MAPEFCQEAIDFGSSGMIPDPFVYADEGGEVAVLRRPPTGISALSGILIPWSRLPGANKVMLRKATVLAYFSGRADQG